MAHKATAEQTEVVEYAKTGKSFKVSAFAGAAKTTTLVMVADELVHDSLYLAYNKRMATEASEKFPGWVEVRTTHSLAYKHTGLLISHKLSRPTGIYRNVAGTPSEIGRYFKIPDIHLKGDKKISQIAIGQVVKDTVNKFEYSADRELTDKHIVYGVTNKFIKSKSVTRDTIIRAVLSHAKTLWKLRSNPASNVLATHETYLKMFQLSNPDLSAYKTIYLDEAQDSNACILDIVKRQSSQLILVGDNFQSIYQWRGSSNALESVDTPMKTLSTSFRFGNHIADIANVILTQTCPVDVKGFDAINSVIVNDPHAVPYPLTKIFRTNTQLLTEAVSMLTDGLNVHIEVDFLDLVRAINSAVALYESRPKDVKHDMFVGCGDWGDAVQEAKFNHELRRIIEMVASGYHTTVLEVLNNYNRPAEPDVIMITAHKSKGLEWDNVIIADDYPAAYNEKTGVYEWEEQERNLAYVAHTRAKKMLCVGESVMSILERGTIKGKLRTRVSEQLDKSLEFIY